MVTLGRHILLEFWGCDPVVLSSKPILEELALRASRSTGATVVGTLHQEFPGGGLSLVVLLSESHLSFHSFPAESENRYCACDIFTCGEQCDPDKAVAVLLEGLKAVTHSLIVVNRGIAPGTPSQLV